MMDVQRMRRVVDDIERGALPRVARLAAERWVGEEEARALVYVRGSANHLFRFQRDGRQYFLRLAHVEERRPTAIAAELDFVRHVAGAGLAVAHPIPSVNGLLIEEISSAGHGYLAVVFEGLRGSELDVDDLDEARYRAWRQSLALTHQASRTFPPHPARPTWTSQARAALLALQPEETAVARDLTSGLSWLESLTLEDQEYGLLHGDFELDNIIWDGQRVQVLDFDDAAYGWYALDFAAALDDVWRAGGQSDAATAHRERRFTWFAEGYAALRPLPRGLPEALPRLLTLLLAVKMARLLRAYATTTDGEYPAWLVQMRVRHQRWLATKRAELHWE
ncbi:MAG: phosphotransferase enzyme family protein [Ktedonobacterales bacterium]